MSHQNTFLARFSSNPVVTFWVGALIGAVVVSFIFLYRQGLDLQNSVLRGSMAPVKVEQLLKKAMPNPQPNVTGVKTQTSQKAMPNPQPNMPNPQPNMPSAQ